MTHHDAEGIGAFLDSDFDDLSSVLSFTIDYLAGPRRALTVGPVCVLIAAARGLACLACLAFLTCLTCLTPAWRIWLLACLILYLCAPLMGRAIACGRD